MPAQHEQNQIPVPIFRMLGSDPIRQYDEGLGSKRQSVITLEPVYKEGGADSAWVNWYFKTLIEGASMDYGYVQAGQENSFTWKDMAQGYELQMPLIAKLRDENKLKVETLSETSEWFKAYYKTTPASSVTVNEDLNGSDRKTVWFDSRFYRLNLLWENGTLRFRDIHLFNEKLPSIYETQKATSNECSFFTLPFVDGYLWSDKNNIVGLRFKALQNGKEILLQGGNPLITDSIKGKLHINWPLTSFNGTIIMDIDEQQIKIKLISPKRVEWFLDLNTAVDKSLPFEDIKPKQVDCKFEGMAYSIIAAQGIFSIPAHNMVFRISPVKNLIALKF